MNMIRSIEQAIRNCSPTDIEAMRNSLPDLGEVLHTAAVNLSRDLTLERIDMMLARLKSAESNLVHLRKAVQIEKWGIG